MEFENGKEFLEYTVITKENQKFKTIYEATNSNIELLIDNVYRDQENEKTKEIQIITYKVEEITKTIITKGN